MVVALINTSPPPAESKKESASPIEPEIKGKLAAAPGIPGPKALSDGPVAAISLGCYKIVQLSCMGVSLPIGPVAGVVGGGTGVALGFVPVIALLWAMYDLYKSSGHEEFKKAYETFVPENKKLRAQLEDSESKTKAVQAALKERETALTKATNDLAERQNKEKELTESFGKRIKELEGILASPGQVYLKKFQDIADTFNKHKGEIPKAKERARAEADLRANIGKEVQAAKNQTQQVLAIDAQIEAVVRDLMTSMSEAGQDLKDYVAKVIQSQNETAAKVGTSVAAIEVVVASGTTAAAVLEAGAAGYKDAAAEYDRNTEQNRRLLTDMSYALKAAAAHVRKASRGEGLLQAAASASAANATAPAASGSSGSLADPD